MTIQTESHDVSINIKTVLDTNIMEALKLKRESEKLLSDYQDKIRKTFLEQERLVKDRLAQQKNASILFAEYNKKPLIDHLFSKIFSEGKFSKGGVAIRESFVHEFGFHSLSELLTVFGEINKSINHAYIFSVFLDEKGYTITMTPQGVPISEPQRAEMSY